MSTARRIHAHKYTAKCPIDKCKYTSKIPYTTIVLDNKNSVHSTTCPKHMVKLIALNDYQESIKK